MDKNMEFIKEKKIMRTIGALEKNNMEGVYCRNRDELLKNIEPYLKDGNTVSVGGSMSLFETGVIDFIREKDVNFLDRYKDGLTAEDIRKIYFESFDSDVYFMSSNAVTESGFLYNVDGRGNRVAALTYGPRKVIVIVGANKIVKNLDDAVRRNEEVAAPANAKRLNRKTPCAVDGICRDCSSPERICCSYVVTKKQIDKNRITVMILDESLGY